MELRAVVLAGVLAAFVASALNTVFWQPLWVALSAVVAKRSGAPTWRPPTLLAHFASLTVHLIAGIALGLLFWLSWGLTGIWAVPWWIRGLSFAALTWSALCAPLLISLLVSAKGSSWLIGKSAIEWLTTCTLVGLACAWSWAKGT